MFPDIEHSSQPFMGHHVHFPLLFIAYPAVHKQFPLRSTAEQSSHCTHTVESPSAQEAQPWTPHTSHSPFGLIFSPTAEHSQPSPAAVVPAAHVSHTSGFMELHFSHPGTLQDTHSPLSIITSLAALHTQAPSFTSADSSLHLVQTWFSQVSQPWTSHRTFS